MTKVVTLDQLADIVPDGARLGIGGVHFSRLPMVLTQRILEIGRRNFTYIGWGGGLPLELFLAAKAVKKLVFCFSSLDIFGLAPRFREALEQQTIETEEWSALAMIQGLHAAQFNLPEIPFQLPCGSDLMQEEKFWKEEISPFTGERVGQARRLDVDVLLLHAQRGDWKGNVEIQGARGLDLSLLGAARKTLVTVEEVVEPGRIGEAPRSFALPHNFVTAIAEVPMGAYPTSCLPYYTTDFHRLLDYVQTEQSRRKADRLGGDSTSIARDTKPQDTERFLCMPPRQTFIRHAVKVSSPDLTEDRLDRHRLSISDNAPYTMDELMVSCLSREYDNSSVCSVGSVSPLAMVSYLLAKRTHATDLTLIAQNGGFIDVDAHPLLITLSESLEFQTAKVCWGGDETYHWFYQPGRITHEVITVAQIDTRGRTNNAWIESSGKRLRLPGQGGMADVANLHKNFTLYLTRHSRERFVDIVSFSTAARGILGDKERVERGLQPGKVQLFSNLGIFELDHIEQRFRLVNIHPGVSLEEVIAQTGGKVLVADPLVVTEPPSAQQLQILRHGVDPFGIRRLEFVTGSERLRMIGEILNAEENLVGDIPSSPQAGSLDSSDGKEMHWANR